MPNQVEKLFNNANKAAAADEHKKNEDLVKLSEETYNVLSDAFTEMMDKKMAKKGSFNMAGAIDGIATFLCMVARGSSASQEMYLRGTREIFDLNLRFANDQFKKYKD